MDIRELQNLNLSNDDFDMILQGLEVLPEKDMAGNLMFDLVGAMISKGDPEMEAKIKDERDKERKKREADKILLKENSAILRGKILMFKRMMQENNLLKEVSEAMET